jgi:hypothetical protein
VCVRCSTRSAIHQKSSGIGAGNDDRRVAGYLDNKRLPAGSVLMDTFISALVWLASDDPHQFVVTSDYDFSAALNRPWDFGVQYILVSNPAGNAAEDAITRRYPTIWVDGGGIGTLVYSVDAPTGRNGGGSTGSTRRRNTSAPHRRASPVCARAVRPGGLHDLRQQLVVICYIAGFPPNTRHKALSYGFVNLPNFNENVNLLETGRRARLLAPESARTNDIGLTYSERWFHGTCRSSRQRDTR